MADALEQQEGVSHVAFNFLATEVSKALESGLEAGQEEISLHWGQAHSHTYVSRMLRSLGTENLFKQGWHSWRDEETGRSRRRRTFYLDRSHPLVEKVLQSHWNPAAPLETFDTTSEEPPREEPPREEPPRDEPPRDEPPRDEPPRDEPPRDEPPRDEPPRDEPPRDEPPRDEPPRDEPPRDEPPRDEPPRDEPPRDEPPRDEPPRDEPPRDEPPREEQPREEQPREQPFPGVLLEEEPIEEGPLPGNEAGKPEPSFISRLFGSRRR